MPHRIPLSLTIDPGRAQKPTVTKQKSEAVAVVTGQLLPVVGDIDAREPARQVCESVISMLKRDVHAFHGCSHVERHETHLQAEFSIRSGGVVGET